MLSLTVAALVLISSDPEAIVTTAPAGRQALPTATQEQLQARLPDASPSTTVQSAAAGQPATPHGLSTAEQISNWIGSSRSERSQNSDPIGDWSEPASRKPRSEFTLGMGTGGYRNYGAAVEMPVGESGTLNLSFHKSENDPYGYGYGYGYGLDRWNGRYGAYGSWAPFNVIEPPGYEGMHYRGRYDGPYRGDEPVSTTGASIGFRLGK